MDPLLFKVLVFIIWFIVPAIPAIIIFKLIPGNKIIVKGPFKGLKVNMTGAFGGYFLLIIASYLMVREMIFEKRADTEVWTLKGFVKDEMGMPLDFGKHQASLTLFPETKIVNGSLDFPVLVNYRGSVYDFPGISISALSSDPAKTNLYLIEENTRELNDPDVTNRQKEKGSWIYDYKNRIIEYRKDIIMKKELPPVSDETANAILEVDSSGGRIRN
jgi:hypothetical protein